MSSVVLEIRRSFEALLVACFFRSDSEGTRKRILSRRMFKPGENTGNSFCSISAHIPVKISWKPKTAMSENLKNNFSNNFFKKFSF